MTPPATAAPVSTSTTKPADQYKYRIVTAHITGTTPYTQGAAMQSEKKDKESHAAYDERCWRERATINGDGNVVVPAQAFYLSLISTCKFYNETIPGQGKKTWTKRFTSGISVVAPPVILPERQRDGLQSQKVYVPSDGRSGGSTRVWRRFPIHMNWQVQARFMIVDRMITEEKFQHYLEQAGLLIGIGTFRRESRGTNGQWIVEKFDWEYI